MFIGPCIIVIVEEWKSNLISLAILFHFLCAQHVSDINIPIIRSLRLRCWITTSVVLFSVRCVLELWCGWFWVVSVLQAEACNTDTFLWKSNKYYIFWVCVCSLRCPAFSARTPYCHLWPVWLYNIFPRYVTKSTVFGKEILYTKCVIWFPLQLLSEKFLILGRNEWDKKCV